ncbi:MAG TPA: acyl-CoA dehydrogenase family protein [Mycobacteriales bacterium]|nr:acyl-CoA dehydrogenase family protein [Mycobacteriales bacterium]
MDLTFSDEQRLLADGVERLLGQVRDFHARRAQLAEGVTLAPAVWRHLADQGLLALPRSEAVGGMGGNIVDVVAIAMRFGAALLTEPYLATVVLAGAALEAAGGDDAKALLAQIAAGDAVVAFAHDEDVSGAPADQITTAAIAKEDGFVLTGCKPLVLGAAEAQHLVISARYDDGVALFLVGAAANGVTTESYITVDGRGAGRVRLDDVAVPQGSLLLGDAGRVIERIVADATIYLAAESVGAMEALFRMTASYAATRNQFGVPIGSFQTVAHRLADMKIALTKAHASLIYVTALQEAGQATASDISALKAQTGRLGRALAEAAVQTHGGVGMTDELAVGHLLKRLLANDALFGDAELHLRLLGSRLSARA